MKKEHLVKLRVTRIIKRGLPLFLTGLSLIIATAYYFSPLAIAQEGTISIPRPFFDKAIMPFVITIVNGSELMNLPADSRDSVVSETEIGDLVYDTINRQSENLSRAYGSYLPLTIILGMLLLLKIASFPLKWLIVLTGWLIFKLLKSLKILELEEKAVLKEELVL